MVFFFIFFITVRDIHTVQSLLSTNDCLLCSVYALRFQSSTCGHHVKIVWLVHISFKRFFSHQT